MSLEVFQACVDGYSDRMFEYEILAVKQGHWAGYFGASKKPKSLKSIIESLLRERSRSSSKTKHVDTVDVEAYKERERRFNTKLKGKSQ